MCCQFSAPGDAAPWVPFYVKPDFTNDPFTRTLSGNASGHAEAHHSSSVKRFGTHGEMPTGPPTPWLKCVVSDHSLCVKCCCCGLLMGTCHSPLELMPFKESNPCSGILWRKACFSFILHKSKVTKSANSLLIQTSLAQFSHSVYDMGKSGPAQNGIWENMTLWDGV